MNTLRVGIFLALRHIQRANLWSTVLIVLIMTLTFLNLVVVSGILTGLVEGASRQVRSLYSSDVIIKPEPGRNYILRSADIIRTLQNLPGVEAFSPRYIARATIQANYRDSLRPDQEVDQAGTQIVGIDPALEDGVTGISQLIVEGSFLSPDDRGKVVIGSDLLTEYFRDQNAEERTISGVSIDDKIRVLVGGQVLEVKVKGILQSKIDEIATRVYFVDRDIRSVIGRDDLNRGEIAVKVASGISPEDVQRSLITAGAGRNNLVQTWEESQGSFFRDISNTFQILGTFLGSIGLFIASVTVFIVIFINAVNRRKYIGIMKAIGIDGSAIELSYVLQSMLYATVGAALGILILFFVLVPYFQENPIDFPFSDGILATTVSGAFIRAAVLFVITVIAGYVPARMIVSQNTVSAILGR